MKISVLVPSLDQDYMAALLPQLRRHGTQADLEVVVCSPYEPEPASDVVWVKDSTMTGNNSAMRQAWEKSTGEIVVGMCDDVYIEPGWLRDALSALDSGQCVVGLPPPETCYCFGRLYANFPVARRETVTQNWDAFFPYRTFWGDVSFSMSVWRNGGTVKEPNPRRQLIHHLARTGHPESPLKATCFEPDCLDFLCQFQGMANEWMASHWRLFNSP